MSVPEAVTSILLADDARGLLTGLLGALGPTGLGWWWLTYRKEKREARASEQDNTAGEVNVVLALLDGQHRMQTQIGELYDRWVASQQVAADARSDAAQARAEAAHAVTQATAATKEVATLRGTLSRVIAHFRPVLAWIDAGAAPPPPQIPEDVRLLLRAPAEEDTRG